MAEVIIELELNRRSGVLAAAIAALRQLPLNFTSQQLVDHEKIPRLILTTEGRISSLTDVEDAYARTRGVSAVLDVRVDGISLPKQPEASERDENADQSTEARSDAGLPARPEQGLALDTVPQSFEAVDRAERVDVVAALPETQSLTDVFNEDAFARHVLVGAAADDAVKDSVSSRRPQAADDQPERKNKQARAGLKGSKLRRRRRLV